MPKIYGKNVRHKYGAKQTVVDEIRFDSKIESNYYKKLLMLQKSGHILFFLRQCPLHLAGKNKLVVDFVEFWAPKDGEEAGEIRFVDVKGVETEAFKIKRKLAEEKFPFKIELVKKV